MGDLINYTILVPKKLLGQMPSLLLLPFAIFRQTAHRIGSKLLEVANYAAQANTQKPIGKQKEFEQIDTILTEFFFAFHHKISGRSNIRDSSSVRYCGLNVLHRKSCSTSDYPRRSPSRIHSTPLARTLWTLQVFCMGSSFQRI